MLSFMENVELKLNHIQVMVRGMYAVAQCEGVHPTELILLKEFYEGCRAQVQGLASFEEVVEGPIEADTMRDILDSPALREMFLKSCLLLAFADGVFSECERNKLRGFAEALFVDDERRAQLEDEVRDHLLKQIAHLQNVEALRDVVGTLG